MFKLLLELLQYYTLHPVRENASRIMERSNLLFYGVEVSYRA